MDACPTDNLIQRTDPRRPAAWAAALCGLIALAGPLAALRAQTATLSAVADNTLYSEDGNQSNGAGQHLFAGRTDNAELRRALIRFDLGSIPAGSTITGANLRLYLSRTRTQAQTIRLHRVLASWGEGTSVAPGEEGAGGAAAPGDATWTYRFFSTTPWGTPGGDYDATASVALSVDNANRYYDFTSAGMAADVQAWLDNPAANFGWIMIGNEGTNKTTKRFDSRQNATAANRPVLTVTYTSGTPVGACCFSDGSCSVTSATLCASQGGAYQGNGTSCSPNPCPQPTGACCLPSGDCVTTTAGDCAAQGGTYLGNNAPCSPNPCSGTTTIVAPTTKDNTLYESATGALSNGAGLGFIAGTSDNPVLRRRGVVAFDVSAIPANAVVTDVRLRLYLGFTQAQVADDLTLHRLLADWGEGTSDASGNETGGASATPNDATWIHRFYNTQFWAAAGGDFASAPSALLNVGTATGYYEWSGAGLVADVQAWVTGAAANQGWLLRGNEAVGRTQRRFESRQNADATRRPRLTITYTIPSPRGACCLPSGNCITATLADCQAQGGTYQGNNTPCASVSCPIELTPYVDALPLPGVAQPVTGVPGGPAHYVIPMQQVTQKLHRDLPPTTVWGYAGSYPGPTIEARRDQPVTVEWVNDLRDAQGNLRTTHFLPIDECLHGPDMTGQAPVAVVHLHGGKVGMDSDGYPEAAFPPGQQSPVYTYPNQQPAATLWYHDHALGITRLNVYMGLAGYYLLRDDDEDALNIPRGEFEVPLAIQDRSFNPDGSLLYPEMWHEHFFGEFLLVNGKVWPYLNVRQGKYRFRVLNGSSSRVYTLALSNAATFHQIGTDQGLLPAPVPMTSITLSTGERADLVVDFAPYPAGTEIILTNSAPAPFPGTPGVGVIPNVMKFIVQGVAGDTDPLPASLVPVPPIPESEAARTRDFVLRKMTDPHCGYQMWAINDLMWNDITELPRRGTTEIWRWINRSGVVHPMHMHLEPVQILDRQDFAVVNGEVVPVGPRVPPPPGEAGWKDTVQAWPNQITRVIARFETFTGLFPYHCHILEHEDHEMMRQMRILPRGDVDEDGDVDQDDLDLVLFNFGQPVTPWTEGDLDGDGDVDQDDLDVLLFSFGET